MRKLSGGKDKFNNLIYELFRLLTEFEFKLKLFTRINEVDFVELRIQFKLIPQLTLVTLRFVNLIARYCRNARSL